MFAGLKEFLNTSSKHNIPSAGFVKVRGPFSGRQVPGSMENRPFKLTGISHGMLYIQPSNAGIQYK